MESTKEEIKKTKKANLQISENNVITSINGIDMKKLEEQENRKKEENKIKMHTAEEDMLNYNILFMLLGLGIGMVFGKFFVSNIAVAMCSGTLIGLVVGIIYTEYLRKRIKNGK